MIKLPLCLHHALSTAVLACTAVVCPALAAAATVIDQQTTDGGAYQIQAALPSQSFTADAATLDSINVNVTNQFFGTIDPQDVDDTTLWMVLYEGATINDADFEIAQVSADAASFLGDGESSSGMLPFLFGGLQLTVGATYTFQLFDFGERYGVLFSNTNPYLGGSAYVAGANPNFDLSFQVTSVAAPLPAVPEPSASLLLVAGLGLFAALTRRRHGASVAAVGSRSPVAAQLARC